ncbi:rhamnogalacturonan acetylesterase [Undibacterium cyanobacteriorum]|uniref:Rhamnogalacturonan acetylesterase n=1 Tax=Undibacterium cyanobacteriorum TaxID=3073561 RepID=A0ABY9REH5_9BURK|nr:rhamnogalacturonan acetylesterase [Undibacterium sp. 20NA77.5]WMW79622.1 rhamnogalacturonan acetylesterase [Undibacterium sp. 20NA77.5]
MFQKFHRTQFARGMLVASALLILSACANHTNHANLAPPSNDAGLFKSQEPRRLILVGDSTMASKSGYGDALCSQLKPAVDCINLARGGRSSGSFRAEGLWQQVQHLLNDKKVKTWVLIQFGHNDQPGKPGRSTDLKTEFPVNMARYVDEVRAWGGIPVLVTPLTRRTFRDQVLENNLLPWAQVVEHIAQDKNVLLLPLNAESYAAVQAMGQVEADTLAVAPPNVVLVASTTTPVNVNTNANTAATVEPQGTPKSAFDRTHVGVKGARLFSTMVLRELIQAEPSWDAYLLKQP